MKHSQNDESLTAEESKRLCEKRSAVEQKLRDVKQRKMELIKVRNALIPATAQPETKKKDEERDLRSLLYRDMFIPLRRCV